MTTVYSVDNAALEKNAQIRLMIWRYTIYVPYLNDNSLFGGQCSSREERADTFADLEIHYLRTIFKRQQSI